MSDSDSDWEDDEQQEVVPTPATHAPAHAPAAAMPAPATPTPAPAAIAAGAGPVQTILFAFPVHIAMRAPTASAAFPAGVTLMHVQQPPAQDVTTAMRTSLTLLAYDAAKRPFVVDVLDTGAWPPPASSSSSSSSSSLPAFRLAFADDAPASPSLTWTDQQSRVFHVTFATRSAAFAALCAASTAALAFRSLLPSSTPLAHYHYTFDLTTGSGHSLRSGHFAQLHVRAWSIGAISAAAAAAAPPASPYTAIDAPSLVAFTPDVDAFSNGVEATLDGLAVLDEESGADTDTAASSTNSTTTLGQLVYKMKEGGQRVVIAADTSVLMQDVRRLAPALESVATRPAFVVLLITALATSKKAPKDKSGKKSAEKSKDKKPSSSSSSSSRKSVAVDAESVADQTAQQQAPEPAPEQHIADVAAAASKPAAEPPSSTLEPPAQQQQQQQQLPSEPLGISPSASSPPVDATTNTPQPAPLSAHAATATAFLAQFQHDARASGDRLRTSSDAMRAASDALPSVQQKLVKQLMSEMYEGLLVDAQLDPSSADLSDVERRLVDAVQVRLRGVLTQYKERNADDEQNGTISAVVQSARQLAEAVHAHSTAALSDDRVSELAKHVESALSERSTSNNNNNSTAAIAAATERERALRASAEQELANARNELAAARAELAQSQRESAKLRERAAALERDAAQAGSNHADLAMRVLDLEESLGRATSERDEMARKVETMSVFEAGLVEMRKLLDVEIEGRREAEDRFAQLQTLTSKMKVTWLPERAVNVCMACEGAFKMFGKTKTFCRYCGRIFCTPCTQAVALPELGYGQERVRVCQSCVAFRQKHQQELGIVVSASDSRAQVASDESR